MSTGMRNEERWKERTFTARWMMRSALEMARFALRISSWPCGISLEYEKLMGAIMAYSGNVLVYPEKITLSHA